MIYYRDAKTEFGGIVRLWSNGAVEVIQRDFGLTWEPECSEAAHRQIYLWFCARYGLVPLSGLFVDPQPTPPPPPPPPPPEISVEGGG
jgi:hypothetical protein